MHKQIEEFRNAEEWRMCNSDGVKRYAASRAAGRAVAALPRHEVHEELILVLEDGAEFIWWWVRVTPPPDNWAVPF